MVGRGPLTICLLWPIPYLFLGVQECVGFSANTVSLQQGNDAEDGEDEGLRGHRRKRVVALHKAKKRKADKVSKESEAEKASDENAERKREKDEKKRQESRPRSSKKDNKAERLKLEADREAQEEAARRTELEAERKVKEEYLQRVQEEAERAKRDYEAKVREQEEEQKRREALEQARLEAERHAREAAEKEQQAKLEAERLATELHSHKESEAAARVASLEADLHAKQQEEREARMKEKQEAALKAAVLKQQEAERKAKEAKRRAKEAAEAKLHAAEKAELKIERLQEEQRHEQEEADRWAAEEERLREDKVAAQRALKAPRRRAIKEGKENSKDGELRRGKERVEVLSAEFRKLVEKKALLVEENRQASIDPSTTKNIKLLARGGELEMDEAAMRKEEERQAELEEEEQQLLLLAEAKSRAVQEAEWRLRELMSKSKADEESMKRAEDEAWRAFNEEAQMRAKSEVARKNLDVVSRRLTGQLAEADVAPSKGSTDRAAMQRKLEQETQDAWDALCERRRMMRAALASQSHAEEETGRLTQKLDILRIREEEAHAAQQMAESRAKTLARAVEMAEEEERYRQQQEAARKANGVEEKVEEQPQMTEKPTEAPALTPHQQHMVRLSKVRAWRKARRQALEAAANRTNATMNKTNTSEVVEKQLEVAETSKTNVTTNVMGAIGIVETHVQQEQANLTRTNATDGGESYVEHRTIHEPAAQVQEAANMTRTNETASGESQFGQHSVQQVAVQMQATASGTSNTSDQQRLHLATEPSSGEEGGSGLREHDLADSETKVLQDAAEAKDTQVLEEAAADKETPRRKQDEALTEAERIRMLEAQQRKKQEVLQDVVQRTARVAAATKVLAKLGEGIGVEKLFELARDLPVMASNATYVKLLRRAGKDAQASLTTFRDRVNKTITGPVMGEEPSAAAERLLIGFGALLRMHLHDLDRHITLVKKESLPEHKDHAGILLEKLLPEPHGLHALLMAPARDALACDKFEAMTGELNAHASGVEALRQRILAAEELVPMLGIALVPEVMPKVTSFAESVASLASTEVAGLKDVVRSVTHVYRAMADQAHCGAAAAALVAPPSEHSASALSAAAATAAPSSRLAVAVAAAAVGASLLIHIRW